MKQGVFWLSSYPKSGNTWFRLVLANLLGGTDQAVSINQMDISRHAADRRLFVEALGLNTYLFSEHELLQLRPTVYRWHSQHQPGVQYFKIHDAYIELDKHTPLVPHQGSLGVIYLIRNPLDVAISFAHHSNITIDQSIDFMCHKQAKIFGNTECPSIQLQQYLLSWSEHVLSWTTDRHSLPTQCIRYEDMHMSPFVVFKQAVEFLGLQIADDKLSAALEHARFEKLQQQEMQQGFRESALKHALFFRKGKVGDWRHTLNRFQIEKIIEHHGEVMYAHGYIGKEGQPIG